MAMTSKEVQAVFAGAAEELGGEWCVVGKGAKACLVRVPAQWWLQRIYYERTSAGRFVAAGGLMARPLPSTQIWDSGVADYRFSADGKRYFRIGTGSELAQFVRAVTADRFDPDLDIKAKLKHSEGLFIKNSEEGRKERIYRDATRQKLVAARVLCGSRHLSDLIADVRWVLQDDETSFKESSDIRVRSPQEVKDYWEELLRRLEGGELAAVREWIAQSRMDTLRGIGVPDELIVEPVFPELEVPW